MEKLTKKRRTLNSLAAIVGHPLRARCWVALMQRQASPTELSDLLRASLQDVSYHVRVLREAGVIEEVESRTVRGAVERFYKATERYVSDDEDTADRSLASRLDIARITLQVLLADAAISLEDGIFVKRPDHCVWRNPGVVDEQGWSRINGACHQFVEEVNGAFEESANRMSPDDPGIKVTVAALAFERDTPVDYWP